GNVAGDVEAGRVTSSARFQARENGLPLALALVKRRFLDQEKLRLALGDATVSSSVSELVLPFVVEPPESPA
ncbi:MAG TPA: hypothetical protein VK116_06160, partial [Planctomycetota bacterium]|nr:hypothetical protein [Planctomycetota bacterium]